MGSERSASKGLSGGRRIMVALFVLACAFCSITWGDGEVPGKFNVPDCSSCHGPADGTLSPAISGLFPSYNPNCTYNLTLSCTVPGNASATGGFHLGCSAGTLRNPGQGVSISLTGLYAAHNATALLDWTLSWRAPPKGTGSVIFSLSVNAANGDGTEHGDRWNTISISVAENQSYVPDNLPPWGVITLAPSGNISGSAWTIIRTSVHDYENNSFTLEPWLSPDYGNHWSFKPSWCETGNTGSIVPSDNLTFMAGRQPENASVFVREITLNVSLAGIPISGPARLSLVLRQSEPGMISRIVQAGYFNMWYEPGGNEMSQEAGNGATWVVAFAVAAVVLLALSIAVATLMSRHGMMA